jgi:L-fuculose-phosphate aldolase
MDNYDHIETDPDYPFPPPVPPCDQAETCHLHRVVTSSEKEARVDLCKFVHRAYNQNLITASSGSFSVRLDPPNTLESSGTSGLFFVITPTNVDRHTLEPSDLCYIASSLVYQKSMVDGTVRKSRTQGLLHHPLHVPGSPESVTPSRATVLHAKIYETHPEVQCIMVVQPPHATAYSITGRKFDSAGIPESYLVLHDVQMIPLQAALKDDGAAVANALDLAKGQTTVLVENYGLIAVGRDLLKSFVQVEVCESMCGVMLTALRRGPTSVLGAGQVKAIDAAFNMAH